MATTEPRYRIVHFDEISPVSCPCGQARRALADAEESPGTVHRTEITTEAKPHYHRRLTETYFILDCGGAGGTYLTGGSCRCEKGPPLRLGLLAPGDLAPQLGQFLPEFCFTLLAGH